MGIQHAVSSHSQLAPVARRKDATMSWRRVRTWTRQHKGRMAYWLQWLDDGRRRTEAVGPDKKLAEALRKRREMELNSE
jgi:hypothetical protein